MSRANSSQPQQQLSEYLETLVVSGYLDTESEAKFFRRAAELSLPSVAANSMLDQVLSEHAIPRERVLMEQFRAITAASIRDRWLDRNEEGNLFEWASAHRLPREQAEKIIEDECSTNNAGRQSTGSKPISRFHYMLIGAGIAVVMLALFVYLLPVAHGPRLSAADRLQVDRYYANAEECLSRKAYLLPAGNSVHHWAAEIAKVSPNDPKLSTLREMLRKAYLTEARAALGDNNRKALTYAELAGGIRPGPDVETIATEAADNR